MDSEVIIQPPLTLRGFCRAVITKHSSAWPPNELTLAQEFLSFFQIEGLTQLRTSEDLCRKLGVNVTVQNLPPGLRGHNCAYQETREIVIGPATGTAAAFGSEEHTLFHELRELIEYEFRSLNRPTAVGPELEKQADLFASVVRSWAVLKSCQPIFRDFPAQSGWGKLGLILFACLLVVANCGYFMLPHWEDHSSN
ncbi:MAG: hypothetical protein L0387_27325 [Acidobacteria bacterium]|nr:hypothetical protein [Acidobacteriota bacterium]